MGAVTLISNGSMMLLKYKLNNVCNAGFLPRGRSKICHPFGCAQKSTSSIYHRI